MNLDDLFHGLVIVLRNIFQYRTHLSAVENRNFDNSWRRIGMLDKEPINLSNFSVSALNPITSG